MGDQMGKYLIRGTAKRLAKRTLRMKIASLVALSAVSLMTVAYGLVSLVNNSGDFTVNVSEKTILKKAIALSSSPSFENPTTVLKAKRLDYMTNISYTWIPEDIGKVDGADNGKNYICYTFYLMNTGETRISYTTEVDVLSASKGADEAVRFMLIKTVAGVTEKRCFAKPKLGTADEPEFWYYQNADELISTTNFYSKDIVLYEQYDNFMIGEMHKFTFVIWLEGDDPECVDNIKSGQVKMMMNFHILGSE